MLYRTINLNEAPQVRTLSINNLFSVVLIVDVKLMQSIGDSYIYLLQWNGRRKYYLHKKTCKRQSPTR